MSNRAKVICHMMTTIDGKISIDWDGNEDYEACGEKYNDLTFSYGQAYGCGRATFQADIQVNLAKYKGNKVEYKDKVILPKKDEFLVVSFDRYGKLFYESNIMEYAGRKSLILEVLTEKATPEYIAYLNEMSIPYMFCGKENFEPRLFLQKIREQYNVETFALCGGAEINAVFMSEDLVDEISIVIGAAIDGTRSALTFVGTEYPTDFPKFFNLDAAESIGNNGVLLKYSKINDRIRAKGVI